MGFPIPVCLQRSDGSLRSDIGAKALGLVPMKAGRKYIETTSSIGAQSGPMSPVDRWRCIHLDYRL